MKQSQTPNLQIPKIYLLDINKSMVYFWRKEFIDCQNVKIINDDFKSFMDNFNEIECVVSPANSFGFMDGGYDKAIIDYFGVELEKEVQKYIEIFFSGMQPVGSSFLINIPGTNKKIIHTPTMRLPSLIRDPRIIYYCMKSTLIEAIKHNIKSIVIPAFGGATGGVRPELIAKYMKAAYNRMSDGII